MNHKLFLITVALIPSLAFAFDAPPNDGFVTDTAGVLTSEQDAGLEAQLLSYRQSTSNEIAVLIINALDGEDIADVAVDVGRKWGIGTTEKDNGVLLLMAYADREIFIAPGYGLEGALPDIVVKGIIEEEMLPHFREGRYYEGLSAGIDALQKHIGGEYSAERYVKEEGVLGFFPFILFFIFIVLDWCAALFARTKSWWLGGVLGGIFGIVLTVVAGWWLAIPFLAALGLLFDYLLSKAGPRRRAGWSAGGFGGRMGGGGGGFGGFGGGSFGGGGARGRW